MNLTKKIKNRLYKHGKSKELAKKIDTLLNSSNLTEDSFLAHTTKEINAFGNEQVPGGHLPSSDIIDLRRKKSPNIIKSISKLDSNKKALAGYYVLYPLNQHITENILSGSILNAKQLQLQDITPKHSQAHSLYIGMLLGKDRISKAVIEAMLIRDIQTYISENKNIKNIFAKAASTDGNRITANKGFRPIENSQISYVDISLILKIDQD